MLLLLPLLLTPAGASEPRIVGGEAASPGAWPHAATVVFEDEVMCGGVLIAPDLVLTAAHCTTTLDSVWLDTVDLGAPGVEVAVTAVERHPDWSTTYDIGLVRLAEAVEVTPARLALDCIRDDTIVDGNTATVVGFGATDEEGLSWADELRQVDVPIVDADCSEPGQGCAQAVSPGGELIAGGEGLDACVGDSGGPLYAQVPDDAPAVIGIVARGMPAATRACGDGGVYVRPDAVIDWIEQAGEVTLPRPDCPEVPPEVVVGPLLAHQGDSATARVFLSPPARLQLQGSVDFATVSLEQFDDNLSSALLRLDATGGEAGIGSIDLVATGLGESQLTTSVTVSVTVLGPRQLEDPGGCSSTPTGAAWLLLAGLLALRRRRSP